MKTPRELDRITDVVLSYRPPEKAKATKRRESGNAMQTKANCTHVYNSPLKGTLALHAAEKINTRQFFEWVSVEIARKQL